MKSPDPGDRSIALATTWLTGSASVILLGALAAGQWNTFVELAAVVTSSAFLFAVLGRYYDDYHRSLQNSGMRWASLAIGLWMISVFVLENLLADYQLSAVAGLAIVAFTYHAGFFFARYAGPAN